jgi:hypothetical protein
MKIKKMILVFCALLVIARAGFSEDFVFENQTIYPNKKEKSKIAIQWASSAKEVDEGNKAVTYGLKLNSSTLQLLGQPGKVNISIPDNAEHFRVLVWSKGQKDPDLLTNWVDVVPNKTYTLTTDFLVPVVLMAGTGC